MIKQIDVTGLPDPVVEAIESIVRSYREQATEASRVPKKRRIGWLRGELTVPQSFFDPLPDDLLDLFEGKLEQPK